MKKGIILSFVLALILSSAVVALADTRYVSDELTVMLRQGMGNQYKILKMLKNGTPLDILEEFDEYYRVRAGDGTEGYVLKQFITSETPKEIVIGRLEKQVAGLKEKLSQTDSLREELQSKSAALGQTEQDLKSLTARHEALKEKSEQVLEISDERDRLQAQNEKLTGEVETLREANDQMFFTGMIKWFLAGGGVFLGGWMIGKMSRKKKKGYSF